MVSEEITEQNGSKVAQFFDRWYERVYSTWPVGVSIPNAICSSVQFAAQY